MSEKLNPNMLFANFNQDFSCISIGTKKGYSITNCDPFGRVYTKNDGARGIVEMLFCTSLIALVGAADQPASSPRKLQIVNTKRESMICELLFPSSILAVKLNRRTLVVVLEVEIYIYDISNMKLLHVIETTKNPEAICALAPSSENSYLAYPSPIPSPTSPLSNQPPSKSQIDPQSQSGDVLVFDTRSLSVVNVVQAHKAPIHLLSINSTGTFLATCSTKGTVIRVFSLPGAQKLYQFRRGMQGARIHSITFNAMSTLLACSSATDTVHIFKLGASKSRNDSSRKSDTGSSSGSGESPAGGSNMEGGYEAFIDGKKKSGVTQSIRKRSMHLGKSIAGGVGTYLPNTLTELWEPSRDFAYLKLPTSGARCIVAINGTLPQVMVISSEGHFYSYNIDLDNGGECSLMKQYNLLDSGEDSTAMGD